MITLNDLAERFASVPRALRVTLDQTVVLPQTCEQVGLDSQDTRGFDVTGVGASEFPARMLVETLMSAGVRAHFRPISSYALEPSVPRRTSLVVFSQGLSPNARLPFRHRSSYDEVHLFTALSNPRDDERAHILQICDGVYRHPPESESGTLLRLVGPVSAALLALRWAALLIERRGGASPSWVRDISEVPARYETASAPAEPLGADPAGCLTPGVLLPMAGSLMWKWQEALYTRLPSVFDVLSFAHGPLQSFVGKKTLLLALESRGGDVLLSNLRASLDTKHHHLHLLKASLPAPLSLFEYDAQLTALALREMKEREISPHNWPGKKADGPLYEVGRVS